MNPRVSAVPPKHRNFLHAKPKLPRQKKNLRIESPALDPLQRQNRLRSPPRESLKSALRIFEPQSQNNPVQRIEYPSSQLPEQRLPLRLQLRPQPPRANRNIRSRRQRRQQLRHLFNRRRQIRIAEHDNLAPRIQHPIAHRVAFPAVARILHQPQQRILCRKSRAPNPPYCRATRRSPQLLLHSIPARAHMPAPSPESPPGACLRCKPE